MGNIPATNKGAEARGRVRIVRKLYSDCRNKFIRVNCGQSLNCQVFSKPLWMAREPSLEPSKPDNRACHMAHLQYQSLGLIACPGVTPPTSHVFAHGKQGAEDSEVWPLRAWRWSNVHHHATGSTNPRRKVPLRPHLQNWRNLTGCIIPKRPRLRRLRRLLRRLNWLALSCLDSNSRTHGVLGRRDNGHHVTPLCAGGWGYSSHRVPAALPYD
ncbi:hypothetical protein SAMN05444161_5598 [Rhizobiales bacterium GAS191]|nr:hypothetical protein SAMN05444161_5598 [Rhizobiales bacterium GAS191]